MAITSFLKRCCPINRPSSSHWRRQSSRTAGRRSWFSGADAKATATTTTRSYALRIILCVLKRRLCHHRSLGMSPLCHSYLMLFIGGNIIIALWHPSVILLLERHRGDREPTTAGMLSGFCTPERCWCWQCPPSTSTPPPSSPTRPAINGSTPWHCGSKMSEWNDFECKERFSTWRVNWI